MKIFILLITALLSSSSIAAGWTVESQVLALRAYPSIDTHYIKLDTTTANETCVMSSTKGIYQLVDSNGRIFSMLLAAQASGNKVLIHTSGCDVSNNYALITEVQFGGSEWGQNI